MIFADSKHLLSGYELKALVVTVDLDDERAFVGLFAWEVE